jgi:ABC-type oligopeptide transport system ATPase subunit
MSTSSCVDDLGRFISDTTGRLTFEEVENRFKEALDENPIFSEIDRSGALGKNIIIIVGSRGCGKTMLLRYIKYKLESEGWKFLYDTGTSIIRRAGKSEKEKVPQVLRDMFSKQESKLDSDPEVRIALAIDDVAEAVELASEELKRGVDLAEKYGRRFKLILATQSERPGTWPLLEDVLPQARFAEMFFGENPKEAIVSNFINSYIKGNAVTLFRGAALINLDAYWSRMRSLDRVKDLSRTIVEIAKFYAKNQRSYCGEAVKMIEEVRHGLALLALTSIPKVVTRERGGRRVSFLIEYWQGEEDGALNGQGIAWILSTFLLKREAQDLAREAENTYSYLVKVVERGRRLNPDDVEEVLLQATSVLGYTHLRKAPLSTFMRVDQPQQLPRQQQGGRRAPARGPQVNVIVATVRTRGGQDRRYFVLTSLKTDERGYITTHSIKKLEALIAMGVPSATDRRYLVVLIPTIGDIKALYKALRLEHGRIGLDVIPVLLDRLSDMEATFIRFVKNQSLPSVMENIASKLIMSTLLLSLRDASGTPYLAYLMLPEVGAT